MQNDNYVLDEKRGKAWDSPSDAVTWYKTRLDEVEAFLDQLKREDVDFYSSAIELGRHAPDGLELAAELQRLMP